MTFDFSEAFLIDSILVRQGESIGVGVRGFLWYLSNCEGSVVSMPKKREEQWRHVRIRYDRRAGSYSNSNRDRTNNRGGGYSSNADTVSKIAISFYVTNLHPDLQPRELWHACEKLENVVDVYIA